MAQATRQDETKFDVQPPLPAGMTILAVGAELKSAPALLVNSELYLAPSVGRLDEPAAYREFLAAIEQLQARHGRATILAHDLHPDYAATRWALAQPLPRVAVQHHHAHAAACMFENGLEGKAVALVCDGTGYGQDGTIWGGEILVCDRTAGTFHRAGHLRPFALLGGDAAAVETYRPALGVLVETFGADWPAEAKRLATRIDSRALTPALARLGGPSARLPRTSSLGRLFDAVAFLLGLCDRNETEAQAPLAVQRAAEKADSFEPLPYALETAPDGTVLLDYRPLVRAMVQSLGGETGPRGENTSAKPETVRHLARGFHEALAEMFAEAARRVCPAAGQLRVVLSGGCFLNALLRSGLEDRLRRAGCEVYTHRCLSPGDECVAVGQVLVAAARGSGPLSSRPPRAAKRKK